MIKMEYIANKKSLKQHKVPEWFHDAKLGIFIHWGLYSVPAFAITGLDLIESEKRGVEEHFKNNPYAEWYLNSLRIPDSPTQKYHRETYGENFTYDDFVPMFNEAIKNWNPDEMATTFKKAGAKYVVLVTKHHDGFLLWPSEHSNPNKENYCASRDIVGELSEAVRKKGMKMGHYYSGVLDWSFTPEPIKDSKDFLRGSTSPEYIEYATNHWYELIDKYETMILWNDIGYPPTNIYEIFAYFYNKHPDGIINDRWRIFGSNMIKWIPYDFKTPEYLLYSSIKKKKWETCRGIGNSFGYNKFETEKEYLSSEELIKMFVDIVSKNGNLLLNVGPMADGTIPEAQVKCLLGLGEWLEVNGEGIFGTRPWKRAEGITNENLEIRFTQKEEALYLHLLDNPKRNNVIIKDLQIENNSIIKMLGYEQNLTWNQLDEDLSILLEDLKDSPAYTIKITPKPIK